MTGIHIAKQGLLSVWEVDKGPFVEPLPFVEKAYSVALLALIHSREIFEHVTTATHESRAGARHSNIARHT